MDIDSITVKKVAGIARLNLTEGEAKKFARDLNEVLSAFRTLNKIPTKGVKPTLQPVTGTNVLRDDKTEPSVERDMLLRNLKNKENGYIKGPKVI